MRKFYEFELDDYHDELSELRELGKIREVDDEYFEISFMGECDGRYTSGMFNELMSTDDAFHDEFMGWFNSYAGMDMDGIVRLNNIRAEVRQIVNDSLDRACA